MEDYKREEAGSPGRQWVGEGELKEGHGGGRQRGSERSPSPDLLFQDLIKGMRVIGGGPGQ